MVSLANSMKNKEKIIAKLHSVFQKTEKKLPNFFNEARITLIPKPDKDRTRKPQTNIANKHKHKNPQQNIPYQNQQYIEIIIHHNEVGFVPVMQGWFNIWKLMNVIYYINNLKKER